MNTVFRLQQLLKIFSIPLRDQWDSWASPESYTLYKYWKVLGLLNSQELQQVFEHRTLPYNKVMERYFQGLDSHFKPAYYKGERVADVGSGFGFITFWLLLSGAEKVYSIGDPDRIGFIQRLYDAAIKEQLLPEGKLVLKPAFVKVGDTTLCDAIPPASLSLVLLNDTLEHITERICPSLVEASYNDLRPQGRFISRQQNTDSPKMLARLQQVWEMSEQQEFLPQRLRIINKKIPTIVEKEALELAQKTRGLDKIDFYAALEQFQSKGTYPQHDLNTAPIDVEIDVPHEGDTSIKRICNLFNNQGFSNIKVYPDWSSSRKLSWLQGLSKAIPQPFMQQHWADQTSVFLMQK